SSATSGASPTTRSATRRTPSAISSRRSARIASCSAATSALTWATSARATSSPSMRGSGRRTWRGSSGATPSGSSGSRDRRVLDHPGLQRPLVRRAPVPARERALADLRRHAHRQPRPRVVLHARRLRRAVRRVADGQLRRRARRGRAGDRAHRRRHGAALPPAAPRSDARPGADGGRLPRAGRVARRVRPRCGPRRARRRDRRRVPRRLPGRGLRGPPVRVRRRHRRRARQPPRGDGRQPPRRAARQLRQGALPRAVLLHALRTDGADPGAAAHGPLRPRVTDGATGASLRPPTVRSGLAAPATTVDRKVVAGFVALAGAGALAPVLPAYPLTLLTQAAIIAVLAMSLDVLLGYTGLPSLGHAAYFGIAAYTVAILATER